MDKIPTLPGDGAAKDSADDKLAETNPEDINDALADAVNNP